jgi:hypothetical protein
MLQINKIIGKNDECRNIPMKGAFQLQQQYDLNCKQNIKIK